MKKREELKQHIGKEVKAIGIAAQYIPSNEKSSFPKILLVDVYIDALDGKIHHLWFTPKKIRPRRGDVVEVIGTIGEYDSLDSEGNIIKKYGFSRIKSSKITCEKENVTHEVRSNRKTKNKAR